MGGQSSKRKLVPNRPVPQQLPTPQPIRMVPSTQNKKMVPPDGGWGWMVVLGTCICLFFFPAVTVAFGVLFTGRLEELGAGATEFTIIANGLSTVWSFTALLIAPISELFGYRKVTFTGGLLSFLTLILTAYSTSLTAFALSYSVIGGISCALSTFIGFVIIPHYFDKRKGLANGLMLVLSASGKICMAPLVRLLLDHYGYVWSCLLVGALSLHTCVAGMLYHPPEWHKIPDPGEGTEVGVEVGVTIEGEGRRGQQPGGTQPPTRRPKVKREDDEDENVIFVMPTIPVQPPRSHDDEVILFSREAERPDIKSLKEEQQIRLIKMGSMSSITGSLPMLPPMDKKVYDDDDENKESFWASCFFIKPFMMLDYAILREPHFHLIAWPNATQLACYLGLMYCLPGYVTSLGYSHYQGAFAISAFHGVEVVFRLILAPLSDFSWFPVDCAYITGFILATISCGCITLVGTYTWILIWVSVFGLAMSLISVLGIHVILKRLGLKRYAMAIGFFSLTNGIITVTVGFLTGLVRDYWGSYRITYLFLTMLLTVATGVWVTWLGVHTSRKYIKLPSKTIPVTT